MKLILCCLSGFLLSVQSFTLSAQDKESQIWEFGIWGGAANYIGDIRPAVTESYNIFSPAFGIFNRINFHKRFAIKTGFNYGIIRGDDQYGSSPFERSRNLSFHSEIFEVATQLEFNFFNYVLRSNKYYFSPYLFVGIAGFHFNPKADLNGETYELQPLGTEGQLYPGASGNEPYKLYQLSIPYGGGFKYNLSKNFTLCFEIGYRGTFTDYLDDISTSYQNPSLVGSGNNQPIAIALADRSGEVSNEPIGIVGRQRGDSKNNDAYIFTGISISYTFTKLLCPPPSNSIFKNR